MASPGAAARWRGRAGGDAEMKPYLTLNCEPKRSAPVSGAATSGSRNARGISIAQNVGNCRTRDRRTSRAATSRGYLLTEALVYIGLVVVVLGVGYAAMYSCVDHSVLLRRN